MNPAQVRALSQRLGQAAREVDQAIRRADALVKSAAWVGEDRDHYVREWEAHRDQLAKVARLLDDSSRSALSNARDQERVSGRGSGGVR